MPQPLWFAFRAYQSETVYGFGSVQEATEYARVLNAKGGKKYGVAPLTPAEIAASGVPALESVGITLRDVLAR